MREQHICRIECNCGVGEILFTYDDDLTYPWFFVSYRADAFYSGQCGVWCTLWNRIKSARFLLSGKEYRLYEVVVESRDITRLKDWINKIPIAPVED